MKDNISTRVDNLVGFKHKNFRFLSVLLRQNPSKPLRFATVANYNS